MCRKSLNLQIDFSPWTSNKRKTYNKCISHSSSKAYGPQSSGVSNFQIEISIFAASRILKWHRESARRDFQMTFICKIIAWKKANFSLQFSFSLIAASRLYVNGAKRHGFSSLFCLSTSENCSRVINKSLLTYWQTYSLKETGEQEFCREPFSDSYKRNTNPQGELANPEYRDTGNLLQTWFLLLHHY